MRKLDRQTAWRGLQSVRAKGVPHRGDRGARRKGGELCRAKRPFGHLGGCVSWECPRWDCSKGKDRRDVRSIGVLLEKLMGFPGR